MRARRCVSPRGRVHASIRLASILLIDDKGFSLIGQRQANVRNSAGLRQTGQRQHIARPGQLTVSWTILGRLRVCNALSITWTACMRRPKLR
jgi:hypothetical protein